MSTILSIAHRGARAYEPENTLRAFESAIALGADGIELDVHMSADNQIVVIHDQTIDRTTSGSGAVAELTLAELHSFAFTTDTRVPVLRQVLDTVGQGYLINIELKVHDAAGPVAALLMEYISDNGYSAANFIVSSFDWTALQVVRKHAPDIPVGVLTATDLDLAISFAAFINAETIHPYYHLLDQQHVANMQQKGFRVFAWTVNEPDDIALIKSYNVDAIIGDYPDRL